MGRFGEEFGDETRVQSVARFVGDDERLKRPIVEVFSNDPRLTDLANWEPTKEDSVL